ncbi:helix-turn-helix domain-containing protein [Microbulbifer elongatus]|uniref:Helix-turn-helix domain-containing protein n=1 Tax=Microbulbifer elongatus TaxID=86173 RepID=A0ABT1P266_9GAMM|nr:helix-turn-helix domain-containing protein [Microbulbifer elongatus]MCQ3830199.1 helix-turn-helix domain-containing protein [Microbulbifer elongatus]
MTAKKGTQANQSIIDGFAVLQALAMSEDPIGSRELARRLGMETTRVNRLLKTLAYMGITQQTPNRKYVPGPGMHVLATQSLYASRLLRSAIAPLEKLAFFGHTVALGVLWQDSVSFLYHRRPGMASAEAIGRIGLRPATTSGIGMALLSCEEETYLDQLFEEREVPGFDDGLPALKQALAEIKESGFARIQVQSDLPEAPDKPTHTIAVPVGLDTKAAVAISGWIPESASLDIADALKTTTEEIRGSLQQAKPA